MFLFLLMLQISSHVYWEFKYQKCVVNQLWHCCCIAPLPKNNATAGQIWPTSQSLTRMIDIIWIFFIEHIPDLPPYQRRRRANVRRLKSPPAGESAAGPQNSAKLRRGQVLPEPSARLARSSSLPEHRAEWVLPRTRTPGGSLAFQGGEAHAHVGSVASRRRKKALLILMTWGLSYVPILD